MAMVGLFQHAYTDGVGASLLLQALVERGETPPVSSADYGVNPDKNPSSLRLFVQGVLDLPGMLIGKIPELLGASASISGEFENGCNSKR